MSELTSEIKAKSGEIERLNGELTKLASELREEGALREPRRKRSDEAEQACISLKTSMRESEGEHKEADEKLAKLRATASSGAPAEEHQGQAKAAAAENAPPGACRSRRSSSSSMGSHGRSPPARPRRCRCFVRLLASAAAHVDPFHPRAPFAAQPGGHRE